MAFTFIANCYDVRAMFSHKTLQCAGDAMARRLAAPPEAPQKNTERAQQPKNGSPPQTLLDTLAAFNDSVVLRTHGRVRVFMFYAPVLAASATDQKHATKRYTGLQHFANALFTQRQHAPTAKNVACHAVCHTACHAVCHAACADASKTECAIVIGHFFLVSKGDGSLQTCTLVLQAGEAIIRCFRTSMHVDEQRVLQLFNDELQHLIENQQNACMQHVAMPTMMVPIAMAPLTLLDTDNKILAMILFTAAAAEENECATLLARHHCARDLVRCVNNLWVVLFMGTSHRFSYNRQHALLLDECNTLDAFMQYMGVPCAHQLCSSMSGTQKSRTSSHLPMLPPMDP